ncbi:hypothetical protein [Allorhodopirellula solitaria]|uniref:Bacterial membrane protein YfhO n=1 Tax=Allorhodopirellula solitaria TaxID=2527987 RepID=A0A5C5YJI5_9BACT|nr:hypothetical protein [Allorhodopirellula solitaria]TWT75040.1 hypothetical protein CA85_03280 [Allorhodopirellula solitaria]
MKVAKQTASPIERPGRESWAIPPSRVAPWIGPLLLLTLFAGVLSGRDRLAFRDVGYFYTPLYEYVAQQCQAQHWGAWGDAIWNESDQTGMPLAGETTTAVFYPLRMLVYAPAWSAETAMGVYVVLHLILASLTAYALARRLRCSPWSAAIAGVGYPLSGMVLFLATNPPFLVGAAWLPLLMAPWIDGRAAIRWMESSWGIRLPNRQTGIDWAKAICIPAIAMAMIILGGDPPTALHAMLVAVVIGAIRWAILCSRRSDPRPAPGPTGQCQLSLPRSGHHHDGNPTRQRGICSVLRGEQVILADASGYQDRFAVESRWHWPTGLAIIGQMSAIVVLASILAAPQIAASLAWSARSDRVQDPGAPEISKIHDQALAFSVPPWRWMELVVPNLYGSPWPINSRWDRILFDGGRTRPETALWTPSLYGGLLLPVLIVFGGIRWWKSPARCRRYAGWPLWVLFLLPAAAALGGYFPVYPWLHRFLPGYDSLRYPAKWLPFVALAITVAAARSMHVQIVMQRWRTRAVRPSAVPQGGVASQRSGSIAWVSGSVVAGLILLGIGVLVANLEGRLSDPFWGPFVPDVAVAQYTFSVACVFLVLLAIGILRDPRWWLICLAVDLVVAHHQLVPTVDRAAESRLLAVAHDDQPSRRWMRINSDGGFPAEWSEQSDPDRILTVEASLRLARFGRWHLEHGDAVVNNLVSIGSREMAEFWHFAKTIDRSASDLPANHWRGWCRLLGVEGLLRCRGGQVTTPQTRAQQAMPVVTRELFKTPRLEAFSDGALHEETTSRYSSDPRDGSLTESASGLSATSLSVRTKFEPLTPDRAGAWRELLLDYAYESRASPARIPPRIANQITRQAGDGAPRVILSRPVYQDGYWQAVLTPRDSGRASDEEHPVAGVTSSRLAEVFQVDFLSQGVLCPPGKWRIAFQYAPWWHRPMLTLASLGWGVVAWVLAARHREASREKLLRKTL